MASYQKSLLTMLTSRPLLKAAAQDHCFILFANKSTVTQTITIKTIPQMLHPNASIYSTCLGYNVYPRPKLPYYIARHLSTVAPLWCNRAKRRHRYHDYRGYGKYATAMVPDVNSSLDQHQRLFNIFKRYTEL